MVAISGSGGCERPSCSGDAAKHYSGPNDNTLHLCKSCYFRLVTGERSLTDPIGLGTDQMFQPDIEEGVPADTLTEAGGLSLQDSPAEGAPASGETDLDEHAVLRRRV